MSPSDSVGAEAYRAFYRGRRVMVTGGMGFVGSNLAHQLAALGAHVLIVDSMIPDATEQAGRTTGLATALGFAMGAGLSFS